LFTLVFELIVDISEPDDLTPVMLETWQPLDWPEQYASVEEARNAAVLKVRANRNEINSHYPKRWRVLAADRETVLAEFTTKSILDQISANE
jgi:hypothetical protein